MSAVVTAAGICERALRAIGQFPTNQSAPQPEHLREAMHWLDLILAQQVGTGRMFSRFDDTLSMTITNGTGSYDLEATLGASYPDDGIEYVVSAHLQDSNGNRYPLEIVTRSKFEDVSKPAETGTPKWVHVDRVEDQAVTLQIYPTPASTDSNSYTLKLVCQRYAPNVAPAGVTGTIPQSSVLHQFGQAWQRYLVVALAHDLGSGPITALPVGHLNRFAAMAEKAEKELLAFTNREHETTAPVCEAWGL